MRQQSDEHAFEPENEEQRRALAFLSLEGSSREPSPFPGPGDRVADFVIEQELGRGGAGVVYRAHQATLGRRVALKLVPHGPSTLTAEYAHRLEREGRLLASVRHESIPVVHAAGFVPGFHYVATDLVDGTTLRELIHAGASGHPRPGDRDWLPFVLALLYRVAGALAAAHARGIVHRDVKPANVLVDRAGRPFLVDFGLAREHGSTGMTLTAGFVGTPQYASPEQLRGEVLAAASDVFSFGVLAFEAISGSRPFEGRTAHELTRAILVADPDWPAARGVPRELCAVIEKCLEKRAGDRYPDAGEVEAEFRRLLNFEPVLAVSRGPIARAWRRARRRPLLLVGGAGVLSFLCAAATAAVLFHERRAAQAERWAAQQEQQLQQLTAGATRRFGKGDLPDYKALLDECLALDPAPHEAAGRRADIHLLEGEIEPAVRRYEQELARGSTAFADRCGYRTARAVLEGRPPELEIADGTATTSRDFMVLGLCQALRHDTLAALAAIEEGIAQNPLPVAFRLQELWYLTRLGMTARLAEELALACTLRKWDATLPCKAAQTLYRQGRYEDEERFLRRRLADARGAASDAGLLAELSLCLCRLGESDTALALAERARELAPSDARALGALVTALVSLHRCDEARTLVRSRSRALQQEPFVLSCSARVALASGALEEAAVLAERLVSIGARADARVVPGLEFRGEDWLVLGLQLRGEVQIARAEYREAIATFEGLQAREPEIPDWPLGLATALEQSGKLVEAEAVLDCALDSGLGEPRLLHAKARLLLARGEAEEALDTLEPALGRRADLDETHYWLAAAYLELRDPTAARRHAREAPRAREAWLEAQRLLDRARTLDPGSEGARGSLEPVRSPSSSF